MGLLDVPIFMGNADIVPGGLHAIMGHQRLIASGPVFFLLLAQLTDCRTQMVGTMLLWDTADLPEALFNAFGERFECLAEADESGFHIRVGEHEMIDQVGKWLSCNRDAHIFHMGKIGLCSFSWGMNLFKDDVFCWSMQRSPPGNMPP